MEMKDKLINICPLPKNDQELLLEYLKEADYEELENLLKEDTVDVNHIYKDTPEFIYEEKNALQITCAYFSAENIEKCIHLLLEKGADIFYKDPDSQKTALHFAAESGNPKILEVVLKFINNKKDNTYIANSDVIYSLIKNIKDSEENEENLVASLKLLLNTDIDINYENEESGWTAVYMAARYKFKQIVQTIIDNKKSEINLDEFKDKRGKSARDLISEQRLYEGNLPPIADENSNITIFTLYKNIRNKSTDMFEENFETIKNNLNENDKCKLLNMAVKNRLEKIVQLLLNTGVNFENSDDNPMTLAAQRGYYKILKLFMSTKPNSDLISQSLFELLKTNFAEENENINYNRCLTLVLRSENLNINAKDYNGNTALHYALRYQDSKMALKILRKGASLATKDSFNKLAVADIDSSTMETHLNGCLRYENEEISTGEDACLRINYTSLLPVDNKTTNINEGYKIAVEDENQDLKDIFVPETEVLEYMCTSQELKQLLKHPVILSFLFLKWYRIAKFFYINLALYLLFVLSLLGYITFDYNIKDGSKSIFSDLSYVLLVITFGILVIREISQMIFYKYKYFLTFENWLEIVLLVSTIFILIDQSDKTARRQFSAIAIVAVAIEFLLLVGQFPSMSTNIMMLRTVSYTFFKLLVWYSILLFAFAYSFYTLFQQNTEEIPNKNSTQIEPQNDDEDEEQDFFIDPGMSLLKTIVMLTGEFDASSIKFNAFPFTTHIIFVMFVFLITIVLFNLLNGLAVSDTQIIKNDAELYGQILRVEHIAHIERVLLNNRIIRGFPAIKKICLFPLNTKKAEGLLYPNQNFKLILLETKGLVTEFTKPEKIQCFRIFTGIYIDKKIQRQIKILMKEMNEEANKKKKEDQIFTEINNLKLMIQELMEKQI